MAANDRALMDVIYAQGWSASPDYMTKEEAAAVTDIGVVFQSKTSITDFSAFKNFVGVTSLANNAFSGCSNLMSIVLPSGVTTIGTTAFRGCSKLSDVHLPSCLTTIGSYAFYICIQLALTELPVNVESIESAAFYNCSTLNSTMQSCTIKYNNGTIGKSGVLGGYSGSGWSYSLETDNGDGTYTYTK